MLVAVGIALLALGLFSGAALVAAAFGALAQEPGFTLWATFPVLCLLGFTLVAAQARPALVRSVSLASAALLLVLALAGVAALILAAAGLVRAPTGAASLWFVVVVGAVLGGLGAASFSRSADPA